MPLPSRLVYNDLAGDEIKHILLERTEQVLNNVPYLQKHLTMPRVKMTLRIELATNADHPNPETQVISDSVEVVNDLAFTEVVDASPQGKRPDQLREEHGLPVSIPERGPVAIEDRKVATVDSARVALASGAVVDRTGRHQTLPRATVVEQDFGPAGLQNGQMNREPAERRNAHRDSGPVAPPRFPGRS